MLGGNEDRNERKTRIRLDERFVDGIHIGSKSPLVQSATVMAGLSADLEIIQVQTRHKIGEEEITLKLVYKDHIYWYNISAIKAWEGEIPT